MKPPPQKCIWCHYDLDLWPLTLKIFPAMPIHVMHVWQVSLIWNPSTKYRNIASREICVKYKSMVRWLSSVDKVHFASLWSWPLTFDLEKLFSNVHWRNAYLCLYRVSFKFLHHERRYRVTRENFCNLDVTLTFFRCTGSPRVKMSKKSLGATFLTHTV